MSKHIKKIKNTKKKKLAIKTHNYLFLLNNALIDFIVSNNVMKLAYLSKRCPTNKTLQHYEL